ncbi:hypothetical protein [Pseudomonas mandelii]|nr:hypothetical protein [Pseudomonas mandelii]
MKPLFRALSSALEHLIPPKRGEGFEDLCLDVFEYVLKKRGIPLSGDCFANMDARGVSGDGQTGIDIWDPATLAVAQCKNQKDIYPSHLDAEAEKLLAYDDRVSHYFFLISHERVRRTLQDWVKITNQKNEHSNTEGGSLPCQPSERLPKFHIVGWGELKGYLLESNFLMWKWCLAHPVIHHYPYLPSLDIKFLVESFEKTKVKSINTPSRRESKDAVAGMLRSIDIDALANIVTDGKVLRNVFDGLNQFVDEWRETLNVARTYSVAVEDIDSRDPIIMERGCSLMNELARHLPRISILRYLHEVYRACDDFLKVFREEDSYAREYVTVEEHGEEREFEGDTTLLFNFSNTDWTSPYYIDPKYVNGLLGKIIELVTKTRLEALHDTDLKRNVF